jgi:hypothetical protein
LQKSWYSDPITAMTAMTGDVGDLHPITRFTTPFPV